MYLLTRTASNPGGAIAGIERALRSIDRDLVLYRPMTMRQHIEESLWQQHMLARWISAFAALALALAAIGLYAIITQAVMLRTREIGVRIALGATPRTVAGLFVREGMWLAAAGMGIGTPVAVAVSGTLSALAPGIAGRHALSLVSAAFILLAVLLTACWIPARRASGVQPVQALRTE